MAGYKLKANIGTDTSPQLVDIPISATYDKNGKDITTEYATINLLESIVDNVFEIGSELDNKANKSATPIITELQYSNWTGESSPFLYQLSVSGVTTNSNQEILPTTDITKEQLEALKSADIQDGGQGAGYIVLKAFGEKPTINLPIRIILRGD